MNATSSGQRATDRFLVKLVSPAGKVVSEQGYDDPQVAMLAFFELTQSRFGNDLGVGAYAALVDDQLEFCSGWTAEGKGSYAIRSQARGQWPTQHGEAALHGPRVGLPSTTTVE
jgi:hypothetical protein